MNRKALYFLIGGGVVALAGLIFLFAVQSSSKKASQTASSSSPNSITAQGSAQLPNGGTSLAGDVTPTAGLDPNEHPGSNLLADGVALQFYLWYTSTAQSPLITGTFKSSPYLTDQYKGDMLDLAGKDYKGGYDPVFCLQNRTKQIATGEVQYTPAGDKAVVNLQKNDGYNVSSIYRVSLEKDPSNNWKINDIICIPQRR